MAVADWDNTEKQNPVEESCEDDDVEAKKKEAEIDIIIALEPRKYRFPSTFALFSYAGMADQIEALI